MQNRVMPPEPPCAVRTIGLIRGQPYHSTPVTKQGDVMLTLFLGGRGRAESAAGVTVITGGMVGVAPGTAEGVLMSDPVDPYIHYYARFSGDYARALAARIAGPGGQARFVAAAGVAELADRLHRFGRITRHELPPVCGDEGLAVLGILESLAWRAEPSAAASPALLTAETLESWLFEHIAEPTDLDRIAAAFGRSRSSLTRAVRTATGTSLQRLHERLRIEWAATLLRASRAQIREIARRVGYDDQFYFSRVFRRRMGVPPREWRTRHADTGSAEAPDHATTRVLRS